MINSDYKKTLLLMVNKLADNKEFWSKKKLKEGKLGSSNIRSVANICEKADCYEELKLYIHYKIAKGNGWNDEFHKNITFGQVILNDMEAIYNDANCDDEEAIKILQEVEGIGTEATRASIIEALKQKEYIQVIKNKLVVTEKGKLLCQAVESQHLLTSAEMTAKWETYLKKIGKREGNQENFITNIKKFIVHLLEAVPNDIEKLNFSDYQEQKEKEAEKSIVGKCPKCGNNIVLKKSFYGCSNYPECKFTLAEHFRKKKLTKTNVKELLEGKETLVKGIKNKTRIF